MSRIYLTPRTILFLLMMLFISQACECDDSIATSHPTEISFLEPTGTLILAGRVKAKVIDLDGLKVVKIIVNGKIIRKKTFAKTTETILTATFDLEAMPDTFKIRVETLDSQEDNASRELTVRKDSGAPIVQITAPTKLDPAHRAIFVGKKFKMIATAIDNRDGVSQITLSLTNMAKKEKQLRQCTGSKQPNKKESCEVDVDVSDDKLFPEGPLVLRAWAVDGKNHTSDPVVKQIMIDKTGPQIKIVEPKPGVRLKNVQQFRVLVADQVGVKSVTLTMNGTNLNAKPDKSKPGHYVAVGTMTSIGAGNKKLEVVAVDNLGNISKKEALYSFGCTSDADCKPGTRCCLSKSPTNKDGKRIGQCFPVQTREGELCDPCTNPCGKGADGKLMGCLPQPCTTDPPYRCRKACYLGNPNQRPDPCRPASGGRPAEYCARSDITKINPTLGSCAIGHNCDPLHQRTCAPGAKPPYNNCCPAGMSCYPADDDANFCVPEGPKKEGETNCNNDICNPTNTCGRSMVCVVSTDQQGRPLGPPKCNRMCTCDQMCKLGFGGQSDCPTGYRCTPLVISNGRVPLPVGACVKPGF